ncbi:hypothetical protein MSVAZ_1488 [Methanosarcina vacuolata Z-761]|uniref:Uncharacterized protein n=1 Tax=Methanosarcina vacuolata Z-761 TaxID=1434123 RepID=A0A0E3Q4U6_9EURY|nr:hypothetical protein MSVAZ_1488 [Methanosarcina vacuolata Z-761]
MNKQSEKRINEKIKHLEQVKEEINNYAANPLRLISYVNESLLQMFVLFAFANVLNFIKYFTDPLYLLTQMITVMLYYYAAMIALKTLSTCKKVRDINKQTTLINEEIKKQKSN